MTTVTDQIVGLNGFTGWKPPVRVATTANITLSGEQTIDGIAVVSGDRVLVKDQTTTTENGIWTCATGAWSRAADFDGARDVVQGTGVLVVSGSTNGLKAFTLTTASPVIASTALEFAEWALANTYSSRSAANASAITTAYSDGTVVFMAGVPYLVDSTATGANSCTNDLSVDGLVPFDSGFIDARCFGIEGDSSDTYDTEFSAMLDWVTASGQATSPSGLSSHGGNIVLLPKGRIRLTSGWTASSVLGLTIRGHGQYATAIEYESDSGNLFDITTYISFILEDLSTIHVDQGAGYGSWTCRMANLDGTGGGRKFIMNRVHTENWAYIHYIDSTVNAGDNWITECDINGAQAVHYSASTQSVTMEISKCRIYGKTDRIIETYSGNTVLSGCNIIIDGSWLYFDSQASKYGPSSIYVIDKCKGEFLNLASLANGSVTKIIEVDDSGQSVSGRVSIYDTALIGGASRDTGDGSGMKVGQRLHVEWRGGALESDANIELVAGSTHTWDDHGHILLDNLLEAPDATQVVLNTDVGTRGYPSVTWLKCQNLPNMTYATEVGPGVGHFRHYNPVSDGVSGYLYNGGGGALTKNLTIDFGGVKQVLKSAHLVSGSRAGGTVTVKVYRETSKTTQIGNTLNVATASSADAYEEITGIAGDANAIYDEFTIEVDSSGSGAAMRGYILLETEPFPENV